MKNQRIGLRTFVIATICSFAMVLCAAPAPSIAQGLPTGGGGAATTPTPPPVSGGNTAANTPAPANGYGLINPLGARSIPQIIGGAVGWLGGLAGGLFFASLVWGGIVWMTAGGSEEKVKAGRSRIVSSMIGIAIVLLAYMIVSAIIGVVPRVL